MEIRIDVNAKTTKTDRSRQTGIASDHAFNFHRRDYTEYAKFVHDELGFKYIRFHGIFDDDMLTYQTLKDYSAYGAIPNAKKNVEINFKQCGDVYDNVLAAGFKPFVELSFMPSALAKGKKTGLRYKNNTCMPKDLNKWKEFISSFIKFLIKRYGKTEVESWYFEVWNEPDLSCFFSGSKKDYFLLYKATYEAVKSVDSSLRVGGPSTSSCKRIKDFKEFCKDEMIGYDFISTHHYPGDAYGNNFSMKDAFRMMKACSIDAKNHTDMAYTLNKMFYRPNVCKTWKKGILNDLDNKLIEEAGGTPLFISEWNSMAVFGSPIHDEKYSAAFVIKTCLDLENKFKGYMFWCFSDIYEEQFMINLPFHGGFGILNNDGIPKPNFYAFKMLSSLYDERLITDSKKNDEVEYAVFKKDNKLQILIYAQNFDPEKKVLNHINININKIYKKASIVRIDDTHVNPKKIWVDMGSPSNLTKKEKEDIIINSKPINEKLNVKIDNSNTLFRVDLYTNDVIMISLED